MPDNPRHIGVATGYHQIRLYDVKYVHTRSISMGEREKRMLRCCNADCNVSSSVFFLSFLFRAQRRPVIDFELKQLPNAFTCIVPSADPNVIALGDTMGNAVELDLRNKRIRGLFRGTVHALPPSPHPTLLTG